MKSSWKVLFMVVVTAVWISAQAKSKATFSLSIQAVQSTVKGGGPVEVEVTKTNTSNFVLNNSRTNNPGENYLFEVRRDGVPAAESEELRHLRKPGSAHAEKEGPIPYATSYLLGSKIAPQETFKETIPVSTYYDTSQPGKYTIQLQQGKVKSNVVTLTVEFSNI